MRLAPLTATTVFSLATMLTACGKPVVKDQRTFDNGKQKSADAVAEDAAAEGHEDHASCLTFWLHEDHCAVGDETADDFANAGDTPDSGDTSPDDDTAADDTADDTPADDTPADDTPADDPAEPATPADPNVVEFRITAGTANKPWNTMAAPVNVKVGQTLRIINDDTVTHRMHSGGQPCPHQPNNMAPGGSYDCVVRTAYDPATGSPMYDHIAGPTARFYVKATP